MGEERQSDVWYVSLTYGGHTQVVHRDTVIIEDRSGVLLRRGCVPGWSDQRRRLELHYHLPEPCFVGGRGIVRTAHQHNNPVCHTSHACAADAVHDAPLLKLNERGHAAPRVLGSLVELLGL